VFICAGVSSLRPLMEIADSPRGAKETTIENVRHAGEIAQKAIDGNFTGPLLTAVTFVSLCLGLQGTPLPKCTESSASKANFNLRSLNCKVHRYHLPSCWFPQSPH
jgi:hypothetical protein